MRPHERGGLIVPIVLSVFVVATARADCVWYATAMAREVAAGSTPGAGAFARGGMTSDVVTLVLIRGRASVLVGTGVRGGDVAILAVLEDPR